MIPFDDLDGERAYATRSMGRAGFSRYAQTKLANVLFTAELAHRLRGTGVTANCFHPGVVATGITREHDGAARVSIKLVNAFARRPERGADTLVWLVDSPDVAGVSGGYFFDRKRVEPAVGAQDPESARRLWEMSEIQAGLAAALVR